METQDIGLSEEVSVSQTDDTEKKIETIDSGGGKDEETVEGMEEEDGESLKDNGSAGITRINEEKGAKRFGQEITCVSKSVHRAGGKDLTK